MELYTTTHTPARAHTTQSHWHRHRSEYIVAMFRAFLWRPTFSPEQGLLRWKSGSSEEPWMTEWRHQRPNQARKWNGQIDLQEVECEPGLGILHSGTAQPRGGLVFTQVPGCVTWPPFLARTNTPLQTVRGYCILLHQSCTNLRTRLFVGRVLSWLIRHRPISRATR